MINRKKYLAKLNNAYYGNRANMLWSDSWINKITHNVIKMINDSPTYTPKQYYNAVKRVCICSVMYSGCLLGFNPKNVNVKFFNSKDKAVYKELGLVDKNNVVAIYYTDQDYFEKYHKYRIFFNLDSLLTRDLDDVFMDGLHECAHLKQEIICRNNNLPYEENAFTFLENKRYWYADKFETEANMVSYDIWHAILNSPQAKNNVYTKTYAALFETFRKQEMLNHKINAITVAIEKKLNIIINLHKSNGKWSKSIQFGGSPYHKYIDQDFADELAKEIKSQQLFSILNDKVDRSKISNMSIIPFGDEDVNFDNQKCYDLRTLTSNDFLSADVDMPTNTVVQDDAENMLKYNAENMDQSSVENE